MADQSDVEVALAGAVGATLYPGGLTAPCAVPGAVVRIYRGWPVSSALDADLAAGRTNVSISASQGSSVNTTRWLDETYMSPLTAPTLLVNANGGSATFSGNAAAGQVAAVIAGPASAAYRTVAGDTPATVAAALAALLAPQMTASVDDATLSVTGVPVLIARTEADQPTVRVTRRQQQTFKVVCWCPDPATRDAVGSTIDAALSAIDFLGLADGTSGRLLAVSSTVSDRWEDATLYRRELVYSVDFATTVSKQLPRMAIGVSTQGLADGAPGAPVLS